MITGDLDAELVRRLPRVALRLGLADHSGAVPAATWRPVPDQPASYTTPLPLLMAPGTDRSPAEVAGALADALSEVSWVEATDPAAAGYLTVTVTSEALAQVAARIVAAGPGCVRSDLLRTASVVVTPWPDIAAARSWFSGWHAQTGAMTARLGEAAGAAVTYQDPSAHHAIGPLGPAVGYYGTDAVRYLLARTHPGRARQLAEQAGRLLAQLPGPFQAVQLAHAEAASTLRWAAELGLGNLDLARYAARLLPSPAERDLLGLLSWLPERVASAARRRRPAEVPRFLEAIATAWAVVRLASPALPFAGAAAASDPAVIGARLVLADAVRTALAAGLALTGISPVDRI